MIYIGVRKEGKDARISCSLAESSVINLSLLPVAPTCGYNMFYFLNLLNLSA